MTLLELIFTFMALGFLVGFVCFFHEVGKMLKYIDVPPYGGDV